MEKFELQKNKEEIISDDEIEEFRKEFESMKKEAEAQSKAGEKNFKNVEFIGLDFNQLSQTDWFLYKLYKEGKLTYKILSHHRAKDLGAETMEMLEKAAKKGYPIDYTTLPREAFFAWLSNKLIAEEAKKKLEEKRQKKAAAA